MTFLFSWSKTCFRNHCHWISCHIVPACMCVFHYFNTGGHCILTQVCSCDHSKVGSCFQCLMDNKLYLSVTSCHQSSTYSFRAWLTNILNEKQEQVSLMLLWMIVERWKLWQINKAVYLYTIYSLYMTQ